MQAIVVERMAQGADHDVLPDQRVEIARPPLSGQDLM